MNYTLPRCKKIKKICEVTGCKKELYWYLLHLDRKEIDVTLEKLSRLEKNLNLKVKELEEVVFYIFWVNRTFIV